MILINTGFSDGLWDVMSQSEVAYLIGKVIQGDKHVYEGLAHDKNPINVACLVNLRFRLVKDIVSF